MNNRINYLCVIVLILIISGCNKSNMTEFNNDPVIDGPPGGGKLYCVSDCRCEDLSEGWQCAVCIYSSYACSSGTDCDCINPRPKSNQVLIEEYNQIPKESFDKAIYAIQTNSYTTDFIKENYAAFNALYFEGFIKHPDTLIYNLRHEKNESNIIE
jgi:hypothetical protein